MTQPDTPRPRSCPTCHSIGTPRDGCQNLWHIQRHYASGPGRLCVCGIAHAEPANLHDLLREEIDRRLAVARAAEPAWASIGALVEAGPDGVPFVSSDYVVAHIALNDPAAVIAWLEAELEVLERHHGYVIPPGQGAYSRCWNCNRCNGIEERPTVADYDPAWPVSLSTLIEAAEAHEEETDRG